MMFHVDDGGILSTGTTGTNPDLGAGTRLMWIPDQAAFRAGEVDEGNGTTRMSEIILWPSARIIWFREIGLLRLQMVMK
jgi:hypothetical protein